MITIGLVFGIFFIVNLWIFLGIRGRQDNRFNEWKIYFNVETSKFWIRTKVGVFWGFDIWSTWTTLGGTTKLYEKEDAFKELENSYLKYRGLPKEKDYVAFSSEDY